MVINNNSVEQINVALLDIEKKLKGITLDTESLNTLKSTVDSIQRSLNEAKNGLASGETYNINISGNASTASYATTAGTANYANSAGSATTAEKAEKDGANNVISTTYQKVSEKDAKAGYVHCDQTANGSYILVATVTNGAVTYSWQARA